MSDVQKSERQGNVEALRTMLTAMSMSCGRDVVELGILAISHGDEEALAGARIAQDMGGAFLLNMSAVTLAGFMAHTGVLALSAQAALDQYSAEVAVS